MLLSILRKSFSRSNELSERARNDGDVASWPADFAVGVDATVFSLVRVAHDDEDFASPFFEAVDADGMRLPQQRRNIMATVSSFRMRVWCVR